MAERFDKLGRRIPDFDRSAASKKGAITQKEKYGPDHHARIGAAGGRARTRGYLGKLKDANSQELEQVTRKGGRTGIKHFAKLKKENPKAHQALSKAGGKVKAPKDDAGRSQTRVRGTSK